MKHFDFDAFDSEISKELKENEEIMAEVHPFRRPGAIGSVPTILTTEIEPLPDPPEAA